jgi:hypothetical protein
MIHKGYENNQNKLSYLKDFVPKVGKFNRINNSDILL